jgi:hypothetical protein
MKGRGIMPASTTAQNPRPITVEHIQDANHVVHGVHGLASVNGDTHAYLTFTWTAALPDLVRIHVINPATGATSLLYIHRDLLRDGGKPRKIKVDFAGDIAFIEVNGDIDGDDQVAWLALNRQWLTRFVDITFAISEGARS